MTAGRIAGAVLAALALAPWLSSPRPATAEPYRLRGNVFAGAAEKTPVGLLTLDAHGRATRWLSAETMLWVGAGDEAEAEAMVIAVHLRDPEGRGEAQVGRFVVVPGALLPVHLDGVAGRVRGPWRTRLELFGGVPVAPGGAGRGFDWVAGARVARGIGTWGAAGLAYVQRRDRGQLDDHELGADVGVGITADADLNARLAYDLINPGVSEARLSGSLRRDAWRFELFASHRSPSRLLPATSLFSVLGDVASRHVGGRVSWRAAPRLDLDATAAVRVHGVGDIGADLRLRGTLRLDERGRRAVVGELRRDGGAGEGWTGARAALRLPWAYGLTLAAEAELAVPDDDRRGTLWPWGLLAVGWRPAEGWESAVAVELSSSPQYDVRVDGIVRLARTWEAP
ncbi:hypothetical protein [Haliangium sp.]|uniref:hypothetical protein n=1 Tax=Haliangium sp. TaxID=2663208 RepID=UPI003D14F524